MNQRHRAAVLAAYDQSTAKDRDLLAEVMRRNLLGAQANASLSLSYCRRLARRDPRKAAVLLHLTAARLQATAGGAWASHCLIEGDELSD